MTAPASHLGSTGTPLQRSRLLGAQVVDEVRRAIVRGELAPGTHLVEDALAAQFDVSRGPVRDALRLLQAERLVEPRRRGVVVVGLTEVDLDELYSLRSSLETLAARTVMRAAPRADTTPLGRAVDAMRAAVATRDPTAFAHADLGFHSCLYALAGHRRLSGAWDHLRPTFAAMLEVTNTEDRDLSPVADDHDQLLRLINGDDVPGMTAELDAHLEQSHARMRRALSKQTGPTADTTE